MAKERFVTQESPELELVREILRSAGRPVDEVLERFASRTVLLRPGVGRICVWFVETGPDGRHLRLAASARPPGDVVRREWRLRGGSVDRVPLEEPLIGQTAATAVPRFARDEVAWPTYPRWARTEGILSYYAAPLLRGDQLLGVLATFHRHRFLDPYAHEAALLWTQALAELLADAVSGAREQARDEEHVSRLAREHAYLRGAEREAGGHGPVLGRSSATGRLRNQIDVAARTEAPVLILGEPGTGRELAARVIHDRSARSLRPLVRLDAAEPGLGETELADHLALAAGSTLLVRNAHLLPHALQLAVLREAEAVEAVPERARIVATAFPELRDSVETGRFDPDLFHRLAVVVIEIVPLRHRPEDVPDLAQHFAAQAARRAGRVAPALSPADRKALQAKPWTGNVWELRLTVERAVAGSGTGPFRLEPVAAPPPAPASEAPILTEAELRTLARENTMRALEAADWKVAGPKGAAALLGLRPTTLAARMKAMGMVRTRKGK